MTLFVLVLNKRHRNILYQNPVALHALPVQLPLVKSPALRYLHIRSREFAATIFHVTEHLDRGGSRDEWRTSSQQKKLHPRITLAGDFWAKQGGKAFIPLAAPAFWAFEAQIVEVVKVIHCDGTSFARRCCCPEDEPKYFFNSDHMLPWKEEYFSIPSLSFFSFGRSSLRSVATTFRNLSDTLTLCSKTVVFPLFTVLFKH